MNVEDLGRTVKSKYPGVYDQYPDAVVGERTLVKYPQYKSQIDPEQSVFGAVKEALSARPEFKPYGGVQDFTTSDNPLVAAEQTLTAPMRVGATISQPGSRKAGEAVAESLGAEGINPKISAAAGTAVSMIPDLAQAGSLINEVVRGPSVVAQAIRNTPRDLSPRYEALNESAGISKDLPVRRGTIPKFPGMNGLPQNVPPPQAPTVAPKIYPKETAGFLNFARARLEGLKDKLSPQELNDYKSMINTAINEGKIARGTQEYAVASQLKKQASELLSKSVPGRSELDEIYALSKKLRIAPELAKKVWEYVGPKMRWGSILVP